MMIDIFRCSVATSTLGLCSNTILRAWQRKRHITSSNGHNIHLIPRRICYTFFNTTNALQSNYSSRWAPFCVLNNHHMPFYKKSFTRQWGRTMQGRRRMTKMKQTEIACAIQTHYRPCFHSIHRQCYSRSFLSLYYSSANIIVHCWYIRTASHYHQLIDNSGTQKQRTLLTTTTTVGSTLFPSSWLVHHEKVIVTQLQCYRHLSMQGSASLVSRSI